VTREVVGVFVRFRALQQDTHRSGGLRDTLVFHTAGDYSSLSMGLSEQKNLYILSGNLKLWNANNRQKIDLLLHQEALFELVHTLNDVQR
jgi:hypothetical protein